VAVVDFTVSLGLKGKLPAYPLVEAMMDAMSNELVGFGRLY
jgi:hypothetical protein